MTVLRQRMLEEMQIRNFSENTQESYLMQVSLFARHFRRSPEGLGPVNIRTYQLYLTNEKKLAPGSIHIATAALRFLYAVTLKRPWDVEDVLPMPKAPQTLPMTTPAFGFPMTSVEPFTTPKAAVASSRHKPPARL